MQEKEEKKDKPQKTSAVKLHDFIEIEYTAKSSDDDVVFDTTSEQVAKDNDIHNPKMKYGPVVICVGEGQVLRGLDAQLVGKEIGKEYTIELKPEDAFGKRSAKQINLINTSKFLKQNIQPVPGLQVTVDDMVGIVKTVTGGRTLVDFNHPLSSKDITYQIKINKKVTNTLVKAESYLELLLGAGNARLELKEKELEVKTKSKMPKEIQDNLAKKITGLIPEIKKVTFTNPA